MEMELERLIGNKLVDEHPLPAGDAVSDEGDKVAMMHPADDFHLRLELSLPLPTPGLELLHGDLLPSGQVPLVDVPKPALPDHVRLREPAGGPRELVVGESALVEAEREVGRRRWQYWRPRAAGVAGAHVAAWHHGRGRWWRKPTSAGGRRH